MRKTERKQTRVLRKEDEDDRRGKGRSTRRNGEVG
jgi:hypothetical protein